MDIISRNLFSGSAGGFACAAGRQGVTLRAKRADELFGLTVSNIKPMARQIAIAGKRLPKRKGDEVEGNGQRRWLSHYMKNCKFDCFSAKSPENFLIRLVPKLQ